MSRDPVRISQGAAWVINRMPNSVYPNFQEELEQAVSKVMHKYGYDSGIAMAFRENGPIIVERTK